MNNALRLLRRGRSRREPLLGELFVSYEVFDSLRRHLMGRERSERLSVFLPADELRAIEEFRYQSRMPSLAAAVRELLSRGLTSIDEEAERFDR
jgi:hypothetical protein